MYDAKTGKEPLLQAIKKYGCEIIYDYKNFNGMAIRKPKDKSIEDTMQHFRKIKGVLSVNYDYVYHLTDSVKPKSELQ